MKKRNQSGLLDMYIRDAQAGRRFSALVYACFFAPIAMACIILLLSQAQNITFLAECMNIANGDVCTIKMK